LPGRTYLITRSCVQRQTWLKPSPLVNQIVRYCAAVAAERTGVVLHSICAMSNHIHTVATDVRGTMPAYNHWAHLFMAKCINAMARRDESMWAKCDTSYVQLLDHRAVFDKMIYTMANPVHHGVVPHARHWPGVVSLPFHLREAPSAVARPAVYFGKKSRAPAVAHLQFVRPDIMPELDDAAFTASLAGALQKRQRNIGSARGKSFAGLDAITGLTRGDTPPGAKTPRKKSINPRFAGHRSRIKKAVVQFRAFCGRYLNARLKHGKPNPPPFPLGTYALRINLSVPTTADT